MSSAEYDFVIIRGLVGSGVGVGWGRGEEGFAVLRCSRLVNVASIPSSSL